MSLILNIDTSTEKASVSLASEGRLLESISNENQKDHAAFLQPAVSELFKNNGLDIKDLEAVALANGPGSYTGLRVGMASAKGFCYALNKPLITIGTLELMAASAIAAQNSGPTVFCPMIDARRMEVFTALYDDKMEVLNPPQAMILDENSWSVELNQQPILFLGNGAPKWMAICQHLNAFFTEIDISPAIFSLYSYKQHQDKNYTPLAYSEPYYLKAFHTTQKRQAT